jgi:alkaline phosphatase
MLFELCRTGRASFLLGISILLSFAPFLSPTLVLCDQAPLARNIILVIGDGMQLEHERAASRYLYGRDFALSFHSFPVMSAVSTWDATTYNRYAWLKGKPPYDPLNFDPAVGYDPALGGTRPYPLGTAATDGYFLSPLEFYGRSDGSTFAVAATDSAAAATAMATGWKTEAGNIAWLAGDPEGGSLRTIAEYMRSRNGASIGFATTVPFSHATPAAFFSHTRDRGTYGSIADEIVGTTKPEVVIGGGHYLWDQTYLTQTAYAALTLSPDYLFVERRAGIDGAAALQQAGAAAAAQGRRLFGLFGGRGGAFEHANPVDSPGAPAVARGSLENPSLADAARAALAVLGRNPKGFFLLLEQGDIDWANHSNDFSWMIGSMWDLDEAVRAVETFVEKPDDGIDWSNTLLIVTADHANSYMRLTADSPLGKGELPRQAPNTSVTGGYVPSFTYPGGEVAYRTGGHTNELVMVYAKGDASRLFSSPGTRWYPGAPIIDNTQILHIMARAAGLDDATDLCSSRLAMTPKVALDIPELESLGGYYRLGLALQPDKAEAGFAVVSLETLGEFTVRRSCRSRATYSLSGVLHIPNLSYEGRLYWTDLVLSDGTGGNATFTLGAFGEK